MDPITNTKRKKRKTRKCLNEIRKRSRHTGHISFERKNDNPSNLKPNYNKCILTNERLSLRMFPKTVRSETITRPVLADLKEKPKLKLDELINGNKVLNTLNSTVVRLSGFGKSLKSTNDNIERYKMENSKSIICSDKYEDSDAINMRSQDVELNDTLNVYSSIDPDEISDKSPSSIGAHSGSSLTSTSNHRFHDNLGYNLYEEFISEIPKYLKQTVKTMKGDFIKKNKVFLKQLLISECCYQKSEDDLLKCIKSTTKYYTPRKVIVHNPMDYIKLSHVQKQSLFHQSSTSRRSFESGSLPPSPAVFSLSPATSHHITSSPNSPLSLIVTDTPDYSYYPHRLN